MGNRPGLGRVLVDMNEPSAQYQPAPQEPLPGQPQPGHPLAPAPVVDLRTPAMLQHLSPLAEFVLPTLGGVIGPLAAWLALRDRAPALDANGKEVLNFRLSVLLYGVVAGFVAFVLFALGLIGGAALGGQAAGGAFAGMLASFFFLALPFMLAFWLIPFILMIVGVVRASSGRAYRYPLTIRFLK